MAPTNTSAFHHRSTTKTDQKPYKSRFATKSALKDQAKGKVERRREEKGNRKTPHQQVMSKLARRNQARQVRIHHHAVKEREANIFQGKAGVAKQIAVVPLSTNIDIESAIEQLNRAVEATDEVRHTGYTRVSINRFGRNLLYLKSSMDMLNAMDTCKVADWVLVVLAADQTFGDAEDQFLRVIAGQGITNVVAVVQGLEATIPAAKRSRHLTQLKLEIGRYFPTLDKIPVLDNKSDCANLVRSLCTAATKGIRWRDDRSWMFVEDAAWTEHEANASSASVRVTGVIRGRPFNPDRLVHVPGWGDFQVQQVTEMPETKHKRKADEMQEIPRTWWPSEDQDDLEELAPEEALMTDATSTVATAEHKGVLLDDHHYFSDDNSHIPPAPKKLPKGTSSYQAAWYLDDMDDSEDEDLDEDQESDVVMDDPAELGPEDGIVAHGVDTITNAELSEYPESEMHVDADDEAEAEALQAFRASRKTQAEDDLEFPDEIELSPEALARERLAKYRGLKSLRTSEWNKQEDAAFEPFEYKRLLQIADYKKSKNAVTREALAGVVAVGTKVNLELRDVPLAFEKRPRPVSLFSLLRHEHKHAVVNLNMTLHSSTDEPVKAKEELVVQVGCRRLTINPLFSAAGNTPNDVHKSDRYLHPGRTAIATFSGPMTWGSVPVLVFKPVPRRDTTAPALVERMAVDEEATSRPALTLVGTATTVPPSHSRVIAKRVILTGHPFKIHKKLVTVRYMFFNREDVAWFAALPLWTKRGRQGFIKESLGTHGYFKATFDGKINPMDAVGVSLYKRLWPRPSRPWIG